VAQRPRNTWTLLYKNGEELWQQPSLNKCQHTLVLRAEGLAVTLLAAMSFNQFYMPGPCKKMATVRIGLTDANNPNAPRHSAGVASSQ